MPGTHHHRGEEGRGGLRLDHAGHTDVDANFDTVVAGGAEVVQEPTDQPCGTRDRAFRDPAGTMIRIQESR